LPFAISGWGGGESNLSNGSISFDQLIASRRIGDMGKDLNFPIAIGDLQINNIIYESRTRGGDTMVELKAEIANNTDQEIRGSLSICNTGDAVVKVNNEIEQYYIVDCENISVKLPPDSSYPRISFGRAFFGNRTAADFDICFDGNGCLIDVEPAGNNLPR
jgi:hypothetical protein